MLTNIKATKIDKNELISIHYNSKKSIRENAHDISQLTGVKITKDRVARWVRLHIPATITTKSKSYQQYWSAERVINAINRLELGVDGNRNEMMLMYVNVMDPHDVRAIRRGIVNPDNLDYFDAMSQKT